MRPVKLAVKGFTSFREACEVDFSGCDLFAITGPTGAGKTSVLDAITYALYGKTTRLDKSGPELMSQGAVAMSVTLEFRVGASEFRVARDIRKKVVTARFEQREGGAWVTPPGPSGVRDVDDRIERTIGLDFPAFTKTVILPQGKFDAFLRGDAKERRGVLGELLDVSVYDRMKQAANGKSSDLTTKAEEREKNIDRAATAEFCMEMEAKFAALQDQETLARATCALLGKALKGAEALRSVRGQRDVRQAEIEKKTGELSQTQDAARDAKANQKKALAAVEAVEAKLKASAYDGARHVQLAPLLANSERARKVRGDIERLQAEQEKLAEELQDKRAQAMAAERRFTEADTLLALSRKTRMDAQNSLDAFGKQYGSGADIKVAREQFELAVRDEARIVLLQAKLREVESAKQSADAAADSAKVAFETARKICDRAGERVRQAERQDLAAALRHDLQCGAACPVCTQSVQQLPAPLDTEALRVAQEELVKAEGKVKVAEAEYRQRQVDADTFPGKLRNEEAQIDMHRAAMARNQEAALRICGESDAEPLPFLKMLLDEATGLDAKVKRSHSEFDAALERHSRERSHWDQAQHAAERVDTAMESARTQIARLSQENDELDAKLLNAPPLPELRLELSALEEARKLCEALSAEKKKHEADVQAADRNAVTYTQSIAVLESAIAEAQQAVAKFSKEIEKQQKGLSKILAGVVLEGPGDEASQLAAMDAKQQGWAREIAADVIRADKDLETLRRSIANNERLMAEVAQLKADQAVYRELGALLNAGNFQSFLLSSASETLAQEGSRHLSELSGGRYKFGTSGEEFAVLDAWNGDESRSVKTLSGGESFVASLSLALALAESITQLSGEAGAVHLESLFLDEGFSTLDGETLSKVADALELLHDGKRLIGIITHLQALADQMPHRIQIEKTATGSRVVRPEAVAAAV